MSWLVAGLGWLLFGLALWRLGRRRGLLADAEHELRAALAAIALAAERMRRSGATVAFSSLVALQLDRVDAALADLGRARGRRGSPVVRAAGPDAGRLAQVLANLIANAAEHGAGPVEVRWSGGAPARLEIRNRNRPPELDDLAARRAAGRGRGLGIARRAARELGASLEVESDGEATVAALELPPSSRAA